ncbi:MAG: hypothetical protein KUG77_21790 [Nannocystaceae bacterium]|nr:hypothetical protein [Nannocystaceae bacterium]
MTRSVSISASVSSLAVAVLLSACGQDSDDAQIDDTAASTGNLDSGVDTASGDDSSSGGADSSASGPAGEDTSGGADTGTEAETDADDNTGADAEPCTLMISPGMSFADAFGELSPGEVLCLADGAYSEAMDIPSDITVRAVHDGMAEIDGGGVLGEEWTGGIVQMHGSNSVVRGLKVHHAGVNADACSIDGTNNTMRVMSCSHGGTHMHKIPLKVTGSGHLIEDSWFYGEGRHITQAFYATDITFRRVVARPGLAVNAPASEPRTGNVLYSTDESLVENAIVLDGRTQSVTRFYHAFSVAAHNVNGNVNPPANNRWLGNFAINMPNGSDGTFGASGITVDPDSNVGGAGGRIEDFTVHGAAIGVHILGGATEYTVEGCSLTQIAGENTIIGNIPAPTTTLTNCNEHGAESPTMRSVDGVKTDELLFPFPNEDLIKRDICAEEERQSDWCLTDLTLSEYVTGG